jgi:hypothetical protein
MTVWLADQSPSNQQAIARGLQDVSGVTEVFAKRRSGNEYRYERVSAHLDAQSDAVRAWASQHSDELVNTMAGASCPDLVALMAYGFGFGRIGGDGGAQEKVQRIPLIIRVPGEPPSTRTVALRLMDVAPEIVKVLRLDD